MNKTDYEINFKSMLACLVCFCIFISTYLQSNNYVALVLAAMFGIGMTMFKLRADKKYISLKEELPENETQKTEQVEQDDNDTDPGDTDTEWEEDKEETVEVPESKD